LSALLEGADPYDELPYRSLPIEWTAPERLALASLLHGGPRHSLDSYRVLELGCGNGANLLPLAYYRRRAEFVGVDGSQGAIAIAETRRAELELANLELVHSSFLRASEKISGVFDFIIAHGIFSWVPEQTRDALFALCASRLRRGGLLYLNYNTKPGWNVRGMVRDMLLANTAGVTSLERRVALAQDVAAKLAASLEAAGDHPYTRLLENEFRFVRDSDRSYVAHEFLAADNHAYWRREFVALARRYGFEHVADADFNYSSGRIPADLPRQIAEAGLLGQPADDTVDLLSYRQLHSPILTLGPWARQPASEQELAGLVVASCLTSSHPDVSDTRMFRHPNGFEVEAKQEGMRAALERLRALWPRGMTASALFPADGLLMDDLRLLHAHGLIELRLWEPGDDAPPPGPLNEQERRWTGYWTTPYHTREPA
jgi:SAM-dependent methyltransferase